ncbi:hypothetical protein T492DRAFT_1150749 [Pavlovales sp. CCMP2436]|nr:hypothetical protein T492DRAFT_1150749 [Pavlovales sp. CCMP2436]
MRRNPFEQHKQELAARQKKEEEDAAAVFATFAESFDGPSRGQGQPHRRLASSFVRGSTINPGAGATEPDADLDGEAIGADDIDGVAVGVNKPLPAALLARSPLLKGGTRIALSLSGSAKGRATPALSINLGRAKLTQPAAAAEGLLGGGSMASVPAGGVSAGADGAEAAAGGGVGPSGRKRCAGAMAFLAELKQEQEKRDAAAAGGDSVDDEDARFGGGGGDRDRDRDRDRGGGGGGERDRDRDRGFNGGGGGGGGFGGGRGSFSSGPRPIDSGDLGTTNLYVGNLAPQVTEEVLFEAFGVYGQIQSIKIMWPRTEEERRRQRNCGFVAFCQREEASAAKDGMTGAVLFDAEMRIGWGKPVALAPALTPSSFGLPASSGVPSFSAALTQAVALASAHAQPAPQLEPQPQSPREPQAQAVQQVQPEAQASKQAQSPSEPQQQYQPPEPQAYEQALPPPVEAKPAEPAAEPQPYPQPQPQPYQAQLQPQQYQQSQQQYQPSQPQGGAAAGAAGVPAVAPPGAYPQPQPPVEGQPPSEPQPLEQPQPPPQLEPQPPPQPQPPSEPQPLPQTYPPPQPQGYAQYPAPYAPMPQGYPAPYAQQPYAPMPQQGYPAPYPQAHYPQQYAPHAHQYPPQHAVDELAGAAPPANAALRVRIESMAARVAGLGAQGEGFEALALERALTSGIDLQFARPLQQLYATGAGGEIVAAARFYRWCVRTLANGGRLEDNRALPAPPWQQQPAGTRELSDKERDALEGLLRRLTISRAAVREAMGFCLDSAAASVEVVETLQESLTILATPAPKKVARLLLVSDVLHNSSAPGVPNASSYRTLLQRALPPIFESLHGTLEGLGSRMGREMLREQVGRVLRAWHAWSVYPPNFLDGLDKLFQKGPNLPTPAPAQPAPTAADDLDGIPAGEAVAAAADDLDGTPVGEGLDGEPLDAPAAAEAEPAQPGTPGAPSTQAELQALPLRELVALCEVRRISSSGSRAEMACRIFRHAARKVRKAAEKADFAGTGEPAETETGEPSDDEGGEDGAQ